jgi:hypothetical protein
MGAGMFTLQGTGSLGNFSLKNKPDINNEPNIFAAVHIKGEGRMTRVLEGRTPAYKVFAAQGGNGHNHGLGLPGKNYGLPRFSGCKFTARFPFASVELSDGRIPLKAVIEGFSPFFPGGADDASLPFGGLAYTLANASGKRLDLVFYFNSANFAGPNADTNPIENGFEFRCGQFWLNAFTDEAADVNTAWFRGGWFDSFTSLCGYMDSGASETRAYRDGAANSPGATLSIPFSLEPGESRTVRVFVTWYAPASDLRLLHEFEDGDAGAGTGAGSGAGGPKPTYAPWYSGRFGSVREVNEYVLANYRRLHGESKAFSDCLFGSDLPPEILEAVSANLSILKSPTVLRQTDGRLWGWEGCEDSFGSCAGSCTHVWNYAQAVCNLFPDLERGLRQTEFWDSQNSDGHQAFRASLPIGETSHSFHAAADGQLGGIVKVYREWRISGDTEWLRQIWGRVRQSLDYCIGLWDPSGQGVLKERHHNTYDIEFYGADIMCTSFYLGALLAASRMAEELGDVAGPRYLSLYEKGRKYAEERLYNGEYFAQEPLPGDLQAPPKPEGDWPEAIQAFEAEGPKYQYGAGCISDGAVGAWLAALSGLGDILDAGKVRSHLKSVYRHNFKRSLRAHTNPQRPGYALGGEGGLLLCSWPNGGKPSFPFVYSDEVWTGIEYQVAAHLAMLGCAEEGLEIVRACRRRYAGTARNPFGEYECGHWYARAMSSYSLLRAYSGAFYDGAAKTLFFNPRIEGDFKCFISTAGGYGYVGAKNGAPFVEAWRGAIPVEKIIDQRSL